MLNLFSVILFAALALSLFAKRKERRENKYFCAIAGYLAVFESVTLVHPEPMGSVFLLALGVILKSVLVLCCLFQLARKKPARNKVVSISSVESKRKPAGVVSNYRRAG